MSNSGKKWNALDEPMSQDAFLKFVAEVDQDLNKLRVAINAHAEVMMIHRYILEKFVPAALLESACKEYDAARRAEIAAEAEKEAKSVDQPQQAN